MSGGIDLPAVTQVQRLEIRPGDRLVVRVGEPFTRLSHQDAADLKARVRAALDLPDEFPVLVATPGIDVAVVSREE